MSVKSIDKKLEEAVERVKDERWQVQKETANGKLPPALAHRDDFAERLVTMLFAQFVDNAIAPEAKRELLERLATECMRQMALIKVK